MLHSYCFSLLSFVILLIAGCNNSIKENKIGESESITTDTLVQYPINKIAANKWSVKDSLYEFILTIDSAVTYDKKDWLLFVKSIDIFSNKNHTKVQTILPEQFEFDNYIEPFATFTIEDMNFDGYNDIRLLNWISANGQTDYWYWLYDIQSKKFKANTELTGMLNVKFNHDKKTVHMWWRSGFESYGHAIYQWKNKQIELVASEEEYTFAQPEDSAILTSITVKDNITTTKKRKVVMFTIDYMHQGKCPLEN